MVAGSFMVDVGVLAGELVGIFSTPCSGLCSGLKATLEKPVGLTRILLSVFLNSVQKERLLVGCHVHFFKVCRAHGSYSSCPRNAEDT